MPVTRQSGLDQSDLLRTAPAVLLTIGLTALLTDSLGTTSHLSPDDARDQLGIVIITIITAVVSAVLAAVVGTSAGTAAVCATVLVSWGAGAHFLLDMNDGDRTAISCIAVAGMLWGLSMTCTADEAVIKGDRALISRRQAILRDPTILMAAFFLSSLAAGGVEATFALYDNDTYHHETIVVLCLLGLAGAAPLVLARDTPLAPIFFAFTLSIWAGRFSAPDSTTVLAFQMAAIAVALSIPLMIRPRVGRAAPD